MRGTGKMEENKIKETEAKFDTISNTGFISRLFAWSAIREDISGIKLTFSELGREISKLKVTNENLAKDLNETIGRLNVRDAEEKKNIDQITELRGEKKSLQDRNNALNEDKKELQGRVFSLETEKKRLNKEVEVKMQKYENLSEKYDKKLEELHEQDKKRIEDHNKKLKSSWQQHEDRVKGAVKSIAERLGITHVPTDKFPFSGRPDNSVIIADEYVIFDAKCPGNPEDLNNFPNYLKLQAANLKKYSKHDGVKKDIYIVIPENTLEILNQFYYEEVDYRVHIITIQSLESVLRSLFKIEEYKTITDLNPEDRENLCRVIGKLLHVSKRRIQVDAFFGTVVHEILKESGKIIPQDMQERIDEYEASDKYNPKTENKSKTIPITEVEGSVKEMQTVAFGQEINTDEEDLKQINKIPLKSEK